MHAIAKVWLSSAREERNQHPSISDIIRLRKIRVTADKISIATLVPTFDGFYHLTTRAWETPAKSSHDGTGDAFMAVQMNADEDVSISMAASYCYI